VHDQHGDKVGFVDQAFVEQGWMQIRVSEFGPKTLWVSYRLVSTGDYRSQVGHQGYNGEGTIGLPVGPRSSQLSAREYGAFLGR